MSRYAFVAMSLSVVAAAALAAGCDHDPPRYSYGDCNPGGCFGCTDNTQQSCWPLPYDPCKADSDCTDDKICTTIGCAARCTADIDCRSGEVCTASGYCAPGNAKSSPITPGVTDPGTGGGNQSEPGVIPCALDSQCFPGETCISGQCTHSPSCGIPATLCTVAADCGAGRDCYQGTCHVLCGVGDVACPIGQRCSSGQCLDIPTTPQCVFDYQCGAASRCINAVCHPLCGLDSQCGKGEFCDSGVCRADPRPVKPAK